MLDLTLRERGRTPEGSVFRVVRPLFAATDRSARGVGAASTSRPQLLPPRCLRTRPAHRCASLRSTLPIEQTRALRGRRDHRVREGCGSVPRDTRSAEAHVSLRARGVIHSCVPSQARRELARRHDPHPPARSLHAPGHFGPQSIHCPSRARSSSLGFLLPIGMPPERTCAFTPTLRVMTAASVSSLKPPRGVAPP